MALALALTGCQQIFGLSPAVVAADANRDGSGDPGCAALPLRAADNDDGDAFDDLVDGCIGTPGTSMNDGDFDALWDDCDPRPGKDHRFCVLTLRDPASDEMPWSEVLDAPGWLVADSTATADANAVVMPLMTRASLSEGPNGIAVETRIGIAGYTAPAHVGLHVESDTGTYDCRIEAGASEAALRLYRDDALLMSSPIASALPPMTTAVLRLTFDLESGGVTTTCVVDAESQPRVTASASETMLPPPPRVGVASESMNTAVYDVVIDKLGE